MGIDLAVFNKSEVWKKALCHTDDCMTKFVHDNCTTILLEQHDIPWKEDVTTFYCCPAGIFVRTLNDWNFEYAMGMDVIPSRMKTQFGNWFFYSSSIKVIRDYLHIFGINTP